MKSIFKWMNYSSILMSLNSVIYCKTVQFATVNQMQFATVNQMQFATVNLKNSNLLATLLPVSYCKNPLKCLAVYAQQTVSFPQSNNERRVCVHTLYTHIYIYIYMFV